jgi:hypothetical protein
VCPVGHLYVEVEDQGSEWDGASTLLSHPTACFSCANCLRTAAHAELRSALDMLIKAAEVASEVLPGRPAPGETLAATFSNGNDAIAVALATAMAPLRRWAAEAAGERERRARGTGGGAG